MERLNQEIQKIYTPKKIIFPKDIAHNKIKKIFAGLYRSYAIFNDFLVTWGLKVYEDEQKNSQKTNFKKVPIKVDNLSLGGSHTFAYTTTINQNKLQKDSSQQVNVYCWGSNINYQLGLQHQKMYGLVKVDLFNSAFQAGYCLKQISCGQNHTLAVFIDQNTHETKLFGCGQSKSNQLALETTGIVPYIVEINYEFNSSLNIIHSKSDYNIALLQNGQIYSWGGNMFNRLGLNPIKQDKSVMNSSKDGNQSIDQFDDKTDRQSPSSKINSKVQKMKFPQRINLPINVKCMALGTYHCLAISDIGKCYSWGNGLYGQLGNNRYGECLPQPIYLNHLPDEITFVSCIAGEQHSGLLDQQNNLYTCGSNAFGVLGHDKHENQTRKKRCKIFQKVQYFDNQNLSITQIASGNRFIMVLTLTNQIFGWGQNLNNQIYSSQSNSQQNCKTQTTQYLNHHINQQNASQRQQQIQNSINKGFSNNEKQQNIDQYNQINQWRARYNIFLNKKRIQEDQMLRQLDQKLLKLSKKQIENKQLHK